MTQMFQTSNIRTFLREIVTTELPPPPDVLPQLTGSVETWSEIVISDKSNMILFFCWPFSEKKMRC